MIKKITIRSCCAAGTLLEDYSDKLVLRPDRLAYRYVPKTVSGFNPAREWSLRTDSPVLADAFEEFAAELPELRAFARQYTDEPGCQKLTITFADGKKERLFCPLAMLPELTAALRELIPHWEAAPEWLAEYEPADPDLTDAAEETLPADTAAEAAANPNDALQSLLDAINASW